MGFHWPTFTRPEPVVDPALLERLELLAVENALLRHQIAETRRHPRDASGRYVDPIKAKAAQLREEMQAEANEALEQALIEQRGAA